MGRLPGRQPTADGDRCPASLGRLFRSTVRTLTRLTPPPQGEVRRALRPPAIPDDVDDPRAEKATGVVTLPTRVSWSSPSRQYDLGDRGQRARVYEQVLVEGTADDVRRFIDIDELIAMWDELYLPDHVRRAWAAWLARHRGVQLSC